MIAGMPDGLSSTDDLAALLARIGVQRAGGKNTPEVAEAQADVLLARISALTAALRATSDGETAALASRILLADLSLLAAQFRGHTNTMRTSLAAALDELRVALNRIDTSS